MPSALYLTSKVQWKVTRPVMAVSFHPRSTYDLRHLGTSVIQRGS